MADETKYVLVVDGERLGGLIAQMLQQKQFGAEVAENGLTAITKMRTALPDVVVADIHVPGGGIKLAELIGVSPKFRNIPIILMSANPTPDTVIRAAGAGANSYLAKPFRPTELEDRIRAALTAGPPAAKDAPSASELPSEDPDQPPPPPQVDDDPPEEEDSTKSEIENRVKSIEGLPAFPATHAQILEAAKSGEVSSDEIAEKLQIDPGLLSTVFKLVNSTYYGFNKQVKDLSLAVTLLGLEEVANLVMAAQVFEKLGAYEDGAGLDLTQFWRHSVGVAFCSRAIAKKLNTEVDSAFLSGMLHDLGKIILDRYFADYYQSVFEVVRDEDLPIAQAELEILGVTHAAIGGQLAEEWRFPKTYLNAIAHHHNPQYAPRYQRLVCLVHLADVMCRELEFGSGGDDQKPQPDEAALDRFSLGERGLTILKEACEEELQDADSFLSALSG